MPSYQTTLQPLSMGELFDRAIRLYRKNFFKFVGIVAVMQIPLAGIEVIANLDAYDRSYLLFPSPAELTEGIGPESMIGPDYFSGVLVNMLLTAAYLVLISGMVLPLIAPIVVLERQSGSQAIRRAWDLVRNRFWWVAGFMVLLYLFNWVVVGGPSLLASFAINLVTPEPLSSSSAQSIYNVQIMIQSLVSVVFNVMYLPLQLTCLTLLYFDLRVRQEGLDLSLGVSAGNGSPQHILERIATSAPAMREKLITGKELSYIAGITVAVLALYLAITIGITMIILAAGSI